MTQLRELRGLITHELGEALRHLAGSVRPGHAIVEVGSFQGKSTCYLASGAGRDVLVYAVDPWDLEGNLMGKESHRFADPKTREAFIDQVSAARLDHKIVMKQGFSTQVAATYEGPRVGMLYVDGSHVHEDVRADVLAWAPHLVQNATVAFDDYGRRAVNRGVKQAVDEFVSERRMRLVGVKARQLAVCRWLG